MSILFAHRRLRWVVPGLVAAAVAVGSLASTVNASASGHPKLAVRTAQELLVNLEKAKPTPLSGTVVETTHLGIPDLSSLSGGGGGGGSADLSLENLLSGSHTLRVFYGGPTQQRLALIGSLSESDVVHDGKDLYTYSSSNHAVTHATLETPSTQPEDVLPQFATPDAQAKRLLAAIDPTTEVTVDRTAYVAGRSAYQVLLVPRNSHSLIGSVRLALDGATSIPLRVQVFARNSTTPALQIGFTDVSFGKPDASVFHFVPPAGTTVEQQKLSQLLGPDVSSRASHVVHRAQGAAQDQGGYRQRVIGKGWTAVLVLDGGAPLHSPLLDQVTTPVAGGQLISSALVSVLIRPDGQILIGSVSAADLAQVATTGQPL